MGAFLYSLFVTLGLAGASPSDTNAYFLRDYEEAVAESARTGKPVFLDAYTTWCAPCRQMDGLVFSDPKVEQMLMRRFIPVRMDMETATGKALAKRFGVSVYPTFVVFDADGELHRGTGFMHAEALESFAEISIDPHRNYRGSLARYRDGNREPALLATLEKMAIDANLPERELYAYQYLLATGDWDSQDASLRLLRVTHSTATPMFDSLVSRRRQLNRAYSAPVVDEKINRLVDERLFGHSSIKPKAAKALIARAYPAVADSTYLRYRMRRAREDGKAKRFGKFAIKSQRAYPSSDPEELTELIYVFEEQIPGYQVAQVQAWKTREAELREQRGW